MSMGKYEVDLSAAVEVKEHRLADSREQVEAFVKRDVEQSIEQGLRHRLPGGSASIDVQVEAVRNLEENDIDV